MNHSAQPVILTSVTSRHFEQMAELERLFYDDSFITPAAESERLFRLYPYTLVAAADGHEIAGFVNLFPVKKHIYDALATGMLNDHDLTAEAVTDLSLHRGEPLYMFLSCIVVAPAYRAIGLSRKLLTAAVQPYLPYLDYCRDVVTDNVTQDGVRFSRRYGFRPVGNSQHASSIFVQPFADFVQRIIKQ